MSIVCACRLASRNLIVWTQKVAFIERTPIRHRRAERFYPSPSREMVRRSLHLVRDRRAPPPTSLRYRDRKIGCCAVCLAEWTRSWACRCSSCNPAIRRSRHSEGDMSEDGKSDVFRGGTASPAATRRTIRGADIPAVFGVADRNVCPTMLLKEKLFQGIEQERALIGGTIMPKGNPFPLSTSWTSPSALRILGSRMIPHQNVSSLFLCVSACTANPLGNFQRSHLNVSESFCNSFRKTFQLN